MHPTHCKTLWLTGLSGAGKTTLAHALDAALKARGVACVVVDGDALRRGLCSDLGFGPADRSENIRRAAELARLLNQSGRIAIVALISPLRADRARARGILGADTMVEVHMSTPLAVCEARDPKGLYQQARAGRIENFTGISAPYEAPLQPRYSFDTSHMAVEDCVAVLLHSIVTETHSP